MSLVTNKHFKILFFALVAIFFLFVLVAMAQAQEINFDEYDYGNIHGQGDWYNWTGYESKEQFAITDLSQCLTGKCLRATDTSANDNFYTVLPIATSSIVNFSAHLIFPAFDPSERFSINFAESRLAGGSSGEFLMISDQLNFRWSPSANVYPLDVPAVDYFLFQVYINCDNGEIQFRVDQQDWQIDEITCSEITNIKFIKQSSATHNYIDDMIIYNEIPTQNEYYDVGLDQYSPDFSTAPHFTCFVGDECNLWFSFNELAIGYDMYLLDYLGTSTPDYAIASTTVTPTWNWQNKILVPPETEEQDKLYNLLLDAEAYGWINTTGIEVHWVSTTTWSDFVEDQIGANLDQYCDPEIICEDISGGSFYIGFACGFRTTLCWAFTPSNNSITNLTNSISALENSFPFNMVFGFLNRANTSITEAEFNNASLGVPFINTEGEYIILPVISSSTMEDTFGESYTVVKTGLDYFVWILVAGLALLVIKRTL